MYTGYQDFANIREMPAFVDKSMLIHVVMNADVRILLTAPRLFGKSVNISMLKRFFEKIPDEEAVAANRKLFNGLLIERCEVMDNHFGKYPVIYLNFFSDGPLCSYENALELVRNVVHEAYKNHSYLQNSNKLNASEKLDVNEWCDNRKFETLANTSKKIERALENLAEYLVKYFNEKVFLLVDEYDNMCVRFILQMEHYEKEERRNLKNIIALCSGLISCLAKGNSNVERVILTGVLYLMTVGLRNLNNVEVFRFQDDHPFYEYYGLSSVELRILLTNLGYASHYDNLVTYYNGYKNNILSVWSVMKCLNFNCKIDNYWKGSGTPSALLEALRIEKIRLLLTKLITNVSNSVEVKYLCKIDFNHLNNLIRTLQGLDPRIENIDIFLNFPLEQGYFSIVDIDLEQGKVEIRIPNKEIHLDFREKLELFYQGEYSINFDVLTVCSLAFDQLTNSTTDNKLYITHLCENLKILFRSSKVDIINEATFHHIIFLVAVYSKSNVYSEIRCLDTNKERLDLLLINCKKIGIIIKLKYGDVLDKDDTSIKYSDVSLYQIVKKKYYDAFKNKKYNPYSKKI